MKKSMEVDFLTAGKNEMLSPGLFRHEGMKKGKGNYYPFGTEEYAALPAITTPRHSIACPENELTVKV